MKNKQKGFTIAELLIVVAIIGVMVAIVIPIYAAKLHRVRVAVDWTNVRSYYSQLQYEFLETEKVNGSYLHEITMSPTGLTSFELSGQTIHLKAGSIWVAEEDKNKGYNILYSCKANHPECQLILPLDLQ